MTQWTNAIIEGQSEMRQAGITMLRVQNVEADADPGQWHYPIKP